MLKSIGQSLVEALGKTKTPSSQSSSEDESEEKEPVKTTRGRGRGRGRATKRKRDAKLVCKSCYKMHCVFQPVHKRL